MYKVVVYVPSDFSENVKSAMFEQGAGKIGEYDQCCWEVEGSGQFRPLKGSEPYTGELGQLTRVKETRIELVCESQVVRRVVDALIAAHPYEQPAFDVWELRELSSLP